MRKKTSFKMRVEATFTFDAPPTKAALKRYLKTELNSDYIAGSVEDDTWPKITRVTVQSITG